MASQTGSVESSAAIKSAADKFYNFFKYNMTDLTKIYPLGFTGAQVVEGVEGEVGCVVQWNYILGGISLTAKVKAEEIDDVARSIKYRAVGGDYEVLYKSLISTLNVSEGLVKWTFYYEKATPVAPPPELYTALLATASILVDAFLLHN